MDKIIVHEFETMESESPHLRPCLLRKAVRGREATLPAKSTLVSVYMRKKLTPLPEPTVLAHIWFYYMEESVLLGTKPLVDSIRHFIRDPSGIFSVCHLCECRIVQWRLDSRLLLLLKWFLHIIKRTLHVGSKIWILCSRGKNNISLEHKIHIFSPPCNILYVWNSVCACSGYFAMNELTLLHKPSPIFRKVSLARRGYLSNTEANIFSHVNGSPCFASLWLGNVWKAGSPRVVTFLLVCLFVFGS